MRCQLLREQAASAALHVVQDLQACCALEKLAADLASPRALCNGNNHDNQIVDGTYLIGTMHMHVWGRWQSLSLICAMDTASCSWPRQKMSSCAQVQTPPSLQFASSLDGAVLPYKLPSVDLLLCVHGRDQAAL